MAVATRHPHRRPGFLRLVHDPTGEAPGTIVVDSGARYLYYVLPDGKAQRYGVGVGAIFGWSGRVRTAKGRMATWTPPARCGGAALPAGLHVRRPDNPLGARRSISTTAAATRFSASMARTALRSATVSSGCIRMRNEDVIELFGRVSVGTRVVVL